jgi:hypothetical protein
MDKNTCTVATANERAGLFTNWCCVFVEYNKNDSNTADPKSWATNIDRPLFNIQVELRFAVTLPVAFVYSSLFRARLNASHNEIRTQGKEGKEEGKEESAKGDVWKEEGGSNRSCMMKTLMICTHNQVLLLN